MDGIVVLAFDNYVASVLIRGLVGHDRRPISFLVQVAPFPPEQEPPMRIVVLMPLLPRQRLKISSSSGLTAEVHDPQAQSREMA